MARIMALTNVGGSHRKSRLVATFDYLVEGIAPCPMGTLSAAPGHRNIPLPERAPGRRALYSPVERARRDATKWTTVQAILAPLQFAVFLVSAVLVIAYLETGWGYEWATASILAKTAILYVIMVTGAIWEKEVFGRYLFAPAFFWEDAMSMIVLALHTAYLVCLFAGIGTPAEQMLLALAAYGAYVVNAAQFVLKLRMARLDQAAAA